MVWRPHDAPHAPLPPLEPRPRSYTVQRRERVRAHPSAPIVEESDYTACKGWRYPPRDTSSTRKKKVGRHSDTPRSVTISFKGSSCLAVGMPFRCRVRTYRVGSNPTGVTFWGRSSRTSTDSRNPPRRDAHQYPARSSRSPAPPSSCRSPSAQLTQRRIELLFRLPVEAVMVWSPASSGLAFQRIPV